jgi:hypothetical protein
MRRGGHFRYVRVAMWGDPRFQGVSADAKLLYLNLRTGSSSNLPGIAYVYAEALARETGLTQGEIRNAIAELQKGGLVLFDRGVAWVKDQLSTDPSRENDDEITNPKHRANIETILGSLPRESLAVKKFRVRYKFPVRRVSRTTPDRPDDRPPDTVDASPNPIPNQIPKHESESETRGGERERNQPPSARSESATTAGSDNGQSHDDPPMKRWGEAKEIRLYGRPLSLLERLWRQRLPQRIEP